MNVGDVALHDYLRSMEEGVSRRSIIAWGCDPLLNKWLTTGWGEPEYRVKFVQWNKDNASWTWVERDEFDEEG